MFMLIGVWLLSLFPILVVATLFVREAERRGSGHDKAISDGADAMVVMWALESVALLGFWMIMKGCEL